MQYLDTRKAMPDNVQNRRKTARGSLVSATGKKIGAVCICVRGVPCDGAFCKQIKTPRYAQANLQPRGREERELTSVSISARIITYYRQKSRINPVKTRKKVKYLRGAA